MAQHYFDDCESCGTRVVYQAKDIVEDDIVVRCLKCGQDVLPCNMCRDFSEHCLPEFHCHLNLLEAFESRCRLNRLEAFERSCDVY